MIISDENRKMYYTNDNLIADSIDVDYRCAGTADFQTNARILRSFTLVIDLCFEWIVIITSEISYNFFNIHFQSCYF